MPPLTHIRDSIRERYIRTVGPVGRALGRLGVTPDWISATGLVLSACAGLLYGSGSLFWGAWVLALAGVCDTLDGQVARQYGTGSRFGAFLDSTLDRYGEVAVFAGLAWHFSDGIGLILVVMALSGSLMVSYTRARAEGLGMECSSGWMQRPERIVLLVIGSLAGALQAVGPALMKLTLLILAVLTHFTALQRILHVRTAGDRERNIAMKERTSCSRCGGPLESYRNPFPTVDIIIELRPPDRGPEAPGDRPGIVLIRRKNPPFGWALPGGFVDYGERLESAAIREAEEETSLKVTLRCQLGAYSDPHRDPRFHTISVVFVASAEGEPRAADDAGEIGVFYRDTLPRDLAFDHALILSDYFRKCRPEN